MQLNTTKQVVKTTKYRKEVAVMMTAKEQQIIKTFALIIPKLSESDKSYLLGLGEGMAIKVEKSQKEEKASATT